jgi:MFS family permease
LPPAGSFTLLAVASTTIMVGCVIVPGLAAIAAHLGVPDAAGWLVTIPSLGVIVFGAPAGKLIGRLGGHRALCCGLFAYGLLGVLGAVLHGRIVIFADRLLLGGATAIVMAAGTVLISEFYAGAARMDMIARQGMAIELGGVIFLFIGGLLATLGWRWPFGLYLVAWLFLAMVMRFVPRPAHVPAAANEAGSALPRAMRVVHGAALVSMVLFFTGVILLPARLHGLGLDAAQTGYFLSFVSLVAVAAAALMPRVVRRLREPWTLALSFGLYAVAHGLFATAPSLAPLVAGAIAMGSGFGLSVPLVNGMTVDLSPAPARAQALAYLSIAIFGGQFLSSFMALLPGAGHAAFAVAAGLALCAALAMALQSRAAR